jgi:hypothetical protein
MRAECDKPAPKQTVKQPDNLAKPVRLSLSAMAIMEETGEDWRKACQDPEFAQDPIYDAGNAWKAGLASNDDEWSKKSIKHED